MSRCWDLELRARAGGFDLEVACASAARVLGVFGPNGAGKSTLVECLAGVRPAQGRVVIDGVPLLDGRGGRAAAARRAGWVPQDGALFPHLTVADNLCYGGAARYAEVLELLELAPLLPRRPHELSGGERQRVALGRALCADPRFLLLDEPLAGVDLARRARVFRHLLAVAETFRLPMLYVSHDPAEVRAIAGHVLLLERGRVRAQGAPEQLLADAAALRLLDSLGFENVFAVAPLGEQRARSAGGCIFTTPPAPAAAGAAAWLAIRAEDVLLAAQEPRGLSARNVFPGVVEAVEATGRHHLVRVHAGDRWLAALTPGAVAELALAPGRSVFVIAKTSSFHWLAG